MNKEYSLDLLELLGNEIRYKKEYVRNDIYRLYLKKNDIELLEKYLTELQAIKNSNPSEALECLERIKAITKVYSMDLFSEFAEDLDTIKQALETKSKKEQAFDYLIKNHLIWLDNGKLKIGRMFDVEIELDETYFDTQEEFDLLKEVLG